MEARDVYRRTEWNSWRGTLWRAA